MKILSIETSCDETAISILECSGGQNSPHFSILGNAIASQATLHAKYGGVFPIMARREHSKNIVPLFLKVLKEAKMLKKSRKAYAGINAIEKMLEREQEMLPQFLKEIPRIAKPKFDAIAVTTGPGLEPALWVGINFSKALATIWNLPIIPVNHMEGHAVSILLQEGLKPRASQKLKVKSYKAVKVQFPAISLLVSGGHTELVLVKEWAKYRKIGQTRDDAAGEAFDKVARMLGLPYPGGPEISREALKFHPSNVKVNMLSVSFPRPMIHSNDFDFSFSGLKTAVLYYLRDLKTKTPSDEMKAEIAHEFENAVVDVLASKTLRALKKYKAKTLIVGGGVSANKALRARLESDVKGQLSNVSLFFPQKDLSTDNSLMIGIAGYFQFLKNKRGKLLKSIVAKGNLSL